MPAGFYDCWVKTAHLLSSSLSRIKTCLTMWKVWKEQRNSIAARWPDYSWTTAQHHGTVLWTPSLTCEAQTSPKQSPCLLCCHSDGTVDPEWSWGPSSLQSCCGLAWYLMAGTHVLTTQWMWFEPSARLCHAHTVNTKCYFGLQSKHWRYGLKTCWWVFEAHIKRLFVNWVALARLCGFTHRFAAGS